MGDQIRDTQLPPGRLDQTRRALTLVELLVVIAIIGILATLFLGAMFGVMESAKVMKTRAMIVKLNNLIMPRYESYRTRRVPIQITQGTPVNVAARYRVDALHELMRMEMPDRMTDIVDPPITLSYPPVNPQPSPPAGGFITRPALSQAYYNALAAITAPNPPVAGSNINVTNQGAECLYMIITLAFVDELGGRDLFNESNVGDTDQDRLPEFLDGWGTPIAFLRWTPGFTESEINGAGGLVAAGSNPGLIVASGAPAGAGSYGLARRNNAYAGKQVTFLTIGPPSVQSATIISSTYDPVAGLTYLNVSGSNLSPVPALGDSFGIDPDPFDPAGAYPSASAVFTGISAAHIVPFAVYPLIYSAGPDKTFGVLSDFSSATPIHYGLTTWPPNTAYPSSINNFPFITDSVSGDADIKQSLGATTDVASEKSVPTWESSGWLDNIHNHMIGSR